MPSGSIGSITAVIGNIAINSTTGISARDGIATIGAAAIEAAVTANANGDGDLHRLVTVSDFTGTISARDLDDPDGAQGCTGISIGGAFDGIMAFDRDVRLSISMETMTPGSQIVVHGNVLSQYPDEPCATTQVIQARSGAITSIRVDGDFGNGNEWFEVLAGTTIGQISVGGVYGRPGNAELLARIEAPGGINSVSGNVVIARIQGPGGSSAAYLNTLETTLHFVGAVTVDSVDRIDIGSDMIAVVTLADGLGVNDTIRVGGKKCGARRRPHPRGPPSPSSTLSSFCPTWASTGRSSSTRAARRTPTLTCTGRALSA